MSQHLQAPDPTGSSPIRTIEFELNGRQVRVDDAGDTLLGTLRGPLEVRSAKDGCSPQGQCGCCTVLVDGQPRVACVTPTRRVAGRSVTTLEGLSMQRQQQWGQRFCETGGSQCGFCTPGIIMRLDALETKGTPVGDLAAVRQALLAHLCRCTGWQTILEAWAHDGVADTGRDLDAATRRATLEGGAEQQVGPEIALGAGGFAADTAPADATVVVPVAGGGWVSGASLQVARDHAGKVQGRRTTVALRWPIEVPEGDWHATLQTTWVEPAYLETDASWCAPGGAAASPLANAGAFGAKIDSFAAGAARALADESGETVVVLMGREDTVLRGAKRPPIAAGIRADGSGIMRIGTSGVDATHHLEDAVAAVAPGLTVEFVPIPGPPTSAMVRAAGWAEAVALVSAARGTLEPVVAANGAVATADIVDGAILVSVRCGEVLDAVVLRSYCIGAAHMAYSWVTSEGLSVDDDGEIHDLTIRSFGIVRAVDTPPIEVEIIHDDGRSVNGSDAVFAAVAAATWRQFDFAPRWPVGVMMVP